MKRLFMFVVWFLLSTFATQADDVLHLKSGIRKSCRVAGGENGDIIIRFQPVPELPPVETRYPISQISSIEFGQDPHFETFLRESTVTQAKELQALWNKFAPFLSFSGSPSGRIGLRLGIVYLETSDNQLFLEALDIFSRIASESTDLGERESAQQGRLRAWVALGRASDAVIEAHRILSRSGGPNLLAEARVILADAKARELEELLAENPRWEEDEIAGKERLRLYNEGLDLCLLASLLPEIAPHIAARALWGALSLHLKCNASSLAVEIARDLTAFFPDTEFAAKAADFLSTLPPETQNNSEALLKPPAEGRIQKKANESTSYEPQKPTVSGETILDASGAYSKRRKGGRDRNQ